MLSHHTDELQDGRPPAGRRRAVVAGTVAATVVLLVVLGLAAHAAFRPGASGGDRPGDPAVPAGIRLVGIGRVTVSVPAAWADDDESCNTPFRDTAFFPWPQDCLSAQQPVVSSVAMSSYKWTEPGPRRVDLRPAGRLHGARVVESEPKCGRYSPLSARGATSRCTQTFAVPDLHAWFRAAIVGAGARGRLAAIRASLSVLPPSRTSVPFLAPATSAEEARRAVRAAGLTAHVVERPCRPRGAVCMPGVVRATPTAGTVVHRGDDVVVVVHPPRRTP